MTKIIDEVLLNKWLYVLRTGAAKQNFKAYEELLSQMVLELDQNHFSNHFIRAIVPAEIYSKHSRDMIASLEDAMWSDILPFAQGCMPVVMDISILPDFDRLTTFESVIIPITTPWDEINQGQSKLMEQLKRSSDHQDYQNIGNTARTLMLKLASVVFDPVIHKAIDEGDGKAADVKGEKYKNQLRVYARSVLMGDENKELRKLALASIEHIHCAIDSMNTLAHKVGAEKHFAEVTTLGTINAIGIVKLIHQLEKQIIETAKAK